MKKLIKIKTILERIPVSRAHLYDLIAQGSFPKQVKLGGTGAYWVEDEVAAWVQAQIDARDADCDSNPHAAVEPEAVQTA